MAKGISNLLTSKNSPIVLVAMVLITISESGESGWLSGMTEVHLVCITVIVCTALVVQGAADVAVILRPPPEKALTKGKQDDVQTQNP